MKLGKVLVINPHTKDTLQLFLGVTNYFESKGEAHTGIYPKVNNLRLRIQESSLVYIKINRINNTIIRTQISNTMEFYK